MNPNAAMPEVGGSLPLCARYGCLAVASNVAAVSAGTAARELVLVWCLGMTNSGGIELTVLSCPRPDKSRATFSVRDALWVRGLEKVDVFLVDSSAAWLPDIDVTNAFAKLALMRPRLSPAYATLPALERRAMERGLQRVRSSICDARSQLERLDATYRKSIRAAREVGKAAIETSLSVYGLSRRLRVCTLVCDTLVDALSHRLDCALIRCGPFTDAQACVDFAARRLSRGLQCRTNPRQPAKTTIRSAGQRPQRSRLVQGPNGAGAP